MRRKLEIFKTRWYVWLFPLFALLLTGWLINDYFRSHGPTIKILFDDASGLQAAKTGVRYRGVAIGSVRDVHLSADQKDVVAEVTLRKDAAHFAVEGSVFSLVTPKLSLQGASGLHTLFDGGPYIAVVPGPADGERKKVFTARINTSSPDTQEDTSAYVLEAANVDSVSVGNSITYRGLKVGTVNRMLLSKDGRTINIQINIENRYSKLIRTNTVFWRKVGVEAKLGLFGSEIKVGSMDSILSGGIEFATPPNAGPMAKPLHKFTFSPAAPKEFEKWNPPLAFTENRQAGF